jgi:tetratricopeptide (TPR) repeat protein
VVLAIEKFLKNWEWIVLNINSLDELLAQYRLMDGTFRFPGTFCRDDGRIIHPRNLSSQKLVYLSLSSLRFPYFLGELGQWFRSKLYNLDNQKLQELMDKADFYKAHRVLLSQWISNRILDNPDNVPFYAAEFRFERDKWFSSLATLFRLLFQEQDFILILDDVEECSQAHIAFLSFLLESGPGTKFFFVGLLHGRRVWAGLVSLDHWNSFQEKLEAQGLLHRTPFQQSPTFNLPVGNTLTDSQRLLEAKNQIRIYCYEDAQTLLHQWRPLGTSRLLSEFHYLLALIAFLMQDMERAILECHTSLENSSPKTDRLIPYRCHLLLTIIFAIKKNSSSAYHSLSQAYRIQKKIATPESLIECQLHEVFLIDQIGGSPDNLKFFDELINRLKNLGMNNRLSYLRSLVPLYNSLIQKKGWESSFKLATETLKESKLIGNLYRESVILHVMGYLFEYTGKNQEALDFFSRSISLRRQLGDPVELIKVYNGTGYFCFSIGRFDDALDYFLQALNLLKNLWDFTEICLTLFNMAQVQFFCGHYRKSLWLIEIILEVMDTLGYEFLPWHSKPKLHSLAGTAAWLLGAHSKALDYFNLTKEEVIDDGARPYFLLFQGITSRENSLHQDALEYLTQGLSLCTARHLIFLRLHFYIEKALTLRMMNKTSEAQKLIAEAITLAQGLGQDLPIAWINWRIGNSQDSLPELTAQFTEETKNIIANLKIASLQEASHAKLVDKIREIQFVKKFQNQIHAGLETEKTLKLSLKLIAEQFLPQRMVPVDTTTNQTLYSHGRLPRKLDSAVMRFNIISGRNTFRLEIYPNKRGVILEEERILPLVIAHLNLILDLQNAQKKTGNCGIPRFFDWPSQSSGNFREDSDRASPLSKVFNQAPPVLHPHVHRS